MRTFCISTLGCKVNQYESEQIATLLRGRGLIQVEPAREADLRVVNTCSVTIQAASKSRQAVRQATALQALPEAQSLAPMAQGTQSLVVREGQRVIVTGCWATGDRDSALGIPGVSAVLGHQDDVARELERLLRRWQADDQKPPDKPIETHQTACELPPESLRYDEWIMQAGTPAEFAEASKTQALAGVKEKVAGKHTNAGAAVGTWSLPVLSGRQSGHQRAFLKVQDGCDAHCSYCIIPRLRPNLRSKGIGEVVEEARMLVAAGHVELVLTGIFLGAYGRPTALRRRRPLVRRGLPRDEVAAEISLGAGHAPSPLGIREVLDREERARHASPLQQLAEALCTRVPGLRRLRFSSLEPGDMDEELLAVLRSHAQVMPHFHLPLQSGSDALLRRMNRQYRRDDYLRMVQRVRQVFDRPALTTDIIVGFPGETDEEFQRTLEVVEACRFIHIHAFPFSPRPGTAAARWERDFVHGPVVNQRLELLRRRAAGFSLEFRRQFVGQTVELLVEKPSAADLEGEEGGRLQHGRCERYFSVFFEADRPMTGQSVRVRIERVTMEKTMGVAV